MQAGPLWGHVTHAGQAAPVQVGTKVFNWENGNWAADADYSSRLDQQWSLEAVRDATYAALAAVGKDSMHFRPPDEQNDHKVALAEAVSNLGVGAQAAEPRTWGLTLLSCVGFYTIALSGLLTGLKSCALPSANRICLVELVSNSQRPLCLPVTCSDLAAEVGICCVQVTCGVHCSVRDEVEAQITRALHPQQVAAQLIWSGEGDWRFLDIVSKNAGKLAALEFVRLKHGFQHSQTVACGDSGNDKDMLGGQNLAIVVGNAQPDLVAWVQSLKQVSKGQKQRLLTTKSHMALGILEGLQQFGFR